MNTQCKAYINYLKVKIITIKEEHEIHLNFNVFSRQRAQCSFYFLHFYNSNSGQVLKVCWDLGVGCKTSIAFIAIYVCITLNGTFIPKFKELNVLSKTYRESLKAEQV